MTTPAERRGSTGISTTHLAGRASPTQSQSQGGSQSKGGSQSQSHSHGFEGRCVTADEEDEVGDGGGEHELDGRDHGAHVAHQPLCQVAGAHAVEEGDVLRPCEGREAATVRDGGRAEAAATCTCTCGGGCNQMVSYDAAGAGGVARWGGGGEVPAR